MSENNGEVPHRIAELRRKKKSIADATPPEIKEKLFYSKGMYPPRERVARLLDPESFFEVDMLATHHSRDFGMEKREIPADGVITGFGRINGRDVAVYSQDFAALGGSFGEMTGRKICALMDTAAENGVPIIGISHSGGLRLHETLGPMEMFGQLFRRNTIYSGVVPQISIILGVVAGGQAYSPGLTDFILMTRNSAVYIAGPAFVKAQTGVTISDQELGGAVMHSRTSGLVDILTETEDEILTGARRLMDFLPSSCHQSPPQAICDDVPDRCDKELDTVVPEDSSKPFDMNQVILPIVDVGSFQEIKAGFAKNMITGFARLNGQSVGVVANQPKVLAGLIDIDASEKAARFVRFCDAFNIPVITFQDSPAYKIGKKMEQEGIIYNGAKLLHAYAEATVPKVTVLVRKAYAGAYIAMGSQYIGADFVYAWPWAEISSVGPSTAASIIFRKEIANAEDPKAEADRLSKIYYDKYVQAYRAASLRHINDIIEPSQTRPVLVRSLELLRGKREKRPDRKHGNIPL